MSKIFKYVSSLYWDNVILVNETLSFEDQISILVYLPEYRPSSSISCYRIHQIIEVKDL